MATSSTLILSSGGIRSFVTTAAILSGQNKPKVILLHLMDERSNAGVRSKFVRYQGKHLGVDDVIELPVQQPKTHEQTHHEPPPEPTMSRARMLMAGMVQAIELGVEHLVWPAQANGNADRAAKIMEQSVLMCHLATLEHEKAPKIDTPILELSDRQLIELGGQLDLPWDLTWSCLMQSEKPCRICDGCRRRHDAFAATGIIDPLIEMNVTA